MEQSFDTAIDFIANAIYVAEERTRGYEPWSWRVLRQEVRDKYVSQAHDLVRKWVDGENEKERKRQQL